jgi:excisionase family DNA binding protein
MDRLLTLGESCKILGVSYSKAQKLAKSGKLPYRRLGGTWVVSQSALCSALGLRFDGVVREDGEM